MASQKVLKKLLEHRGPVWYVREDYVGGNDMVCPRCGGKGTYETMESDCRYNSWTEVRTCHVCEGSCRVSKRYRVGKDDHWYLELTADGIELSNSLKGKSVFLSEGEAQEHAEKLNRKLKRHCT